MFHTLSARSVVVPRGVGWRSGLAAVFWVCCNRHVFKDPFYRGPLHNKGKDFFLGHSSVPDLLERALWPRTRFSAMSSCANRNNNIDRTDDLYDLYDLIPLHDLDQSGQIDSWSVWPSSCCRVGVVSSAWSRSCFLGWICTIQILHNLSQRQGRNQRI